MATRETDPCTTPRRLYSIRPDSGYFDVGVTDDGRQVLMGPWLPDLVAVFFDASGNLVGRESRRPGFLHNRGVVVDGSPVEGSVESLDVNDPRTLASIAAWQGELGFQPATIRVRRFHLDNLGVGIADHPDHLVEILSAPRASDADKENARDSLRSWDADGQFVLRWGEEFWLDDAGEVVAS